ncbi:hypothetical protein [Leptolyngbya sp. FACHB-261]|uniref:hypothetical protein n=1 Tax=Leptolyngbya sp. FACHB-261 TaxID=2692806 RepID=UPI001682D466|nr:hypothetical protein [Leptolyngbya sp. FACHB-261]MBD2104701.1 hypothetical protein [Leptolyngbya sp. FACHB-261]
MEEFFLFNPNDPDDIASWVQGRRQLIDRLEELEWEAGVHFALYPDGRLGFCEELILSLHEEVPVQTGHLIGADLVFRAAELDEKALEHEAD